MHSGFTDECVLTTVVMPNECDYSVNINFLIFNCIIKPFSQTINTVLVASQLMLFCIEKLFCFFRLLIMALFMF